MTIIHKGIRRKTTDVLDDYGQAQYAQNWRYRLAGEIGRRPGIGKTDMAKQAGPVLLLGFGSYFEPYVVQMVGGDVIATADPLPLWADPVMVIPGGRVGSPQAPVINAVDANPLSPQVYIVGNVTFTPDITYDGLSGPLIYDWFATGWAGGGPPMPDTGVDPTYIPNLDASCPPGFYSFQLNIFTTVGGFSDSFPFTFSVT